MKTLISVFSTFFFFVNSAPINNHHCSLTLDSVRYVSYLDLVCAQFFFNGVGFLPGTQHITFNDLDVQINVEHEKVEHNISLSNKVCNEWGNIGYITDNRDIQDHKSSIFLCGNADLGYTKSEISVQNHTTPLLRGTLYTKKRKNISIQCPISIDRIPTVELYKKVPSDICNYNNCTVTCASLTLGAGREYVLPGQRLDLVQETTLDDALTISDVRLWHIIRSGIMCIELKLHFSSDVSRFYLHDDTDLHLSNKQWTREPVKFNNDVCVSTISNYNTEAHYFIWKEPTFLCTSESISSLSRKMIVEGNITYVTTTKSGHRVKDSKRLVHRFYSVQKTKSHLENHCLSYKSGKGCKDCRSSCIASIKGHGYLYCKNGWTYKYFDHIDSKSVFIPFESERDNLTNHNPVGDENKKPYSLMTHLHWILACLVAAILVITCVIEMYRRCRCFSV